jgi:hypothetical protein
MVYRKGYRTTEPFVTVYTSHLYFDFPVAVQMSQLTCHRTARAVTNSSTCKGNIIPK